MAEAMELDLSLNQPGKQPIENPVPTPLESTEIEKKSDVPSEFTIEKYYDNDSLGSDVLKQKYLAPGEKHPYQLWTRQAAALASVEKTKSAQKKWEKKFFSILKDFRFVPGGRIMHGAGREDITTTLNNCYVVAVRDDSIKSIYDTIINEALTYKYGGGCGHDLSVLRPECSLTS